MLHLLPNTELSYDFKSIYKLYLYYVFVLHSDEHTGEKEPLQSVS
jgi:hypothetical protein